MEYNIYFNRLCTELEVPSEPTREQLVTAFINKVGGPENLLNLFVKRCIIVPNDIQDVNVELETSKNETN